MAAFKKGDRVAWHHTFAAGHAEGSIVRADAVPTFPKDHPFHGDPGSGQLGTIAGPGDPSDENGFLWAVQLDGEKDERVLTADEIVRVKESS